MDILIAVSYTNIVGMVTYYIGNGRWSIISDNSQAKLFLDEKDAISCMVNYGYHPSNLKLVKVTVSPEIAHAVKLAANAI